MDNFEVTFDELDALAQQLTDCANQDLTDARSILDETAAQAALTADLSTGRTVGSFDGTYQVRMDVSYEWNDVIDPNPQYSTDRWKSQLAEILTLGQADPYDIHIGWQEPTTVILDAQGNVVSMEGYPG